MEPSATALSYAPPRTCHRHWRAFQRCAVIVSITAVAVIYGPRWWRTAQFLFWQDRCMNLISPAAAPVYETNPSLASRLRAAGTHLPPAGSPGTARGGPAVHVPPCWRHFVQLSQLTWPSYQRFRDPIVFMRRYRAADGQDGLLVVSASPGSNNSLSISAWFVPRLSTTRQATVAPLPIVSGTFYLQDAAFTGPALPGSRVFPARVDPSDSSHFMIPYEMSGSKHVAHCWTGGHADALIVVQRPS